MDDPLILILLVYQFYTVRMCHMSDNIKLITAGNYGSINTSVTYHDIAIAPMAAMATWLATFVNFIVV